MTHYTQFRADYIRKHTPDGIAMTEYAECMDEQDCLNAWWAYTLPFLRNGSLSTAWWNHVVKDKRLYGFVARWMHDYPDHARQWGHAQAWAMAHVRRRGA